jgi:serine/threonine protein kinase
MVDADRKNEGVVGIALGLLFVYGLGLLHGAVKASNIFFDADPWIQVADFGSIRLEKREVKPFSRET